MIIDPLTRLRALVQRHGSQRAVARSLGVSASLLSEWLLGRRPVPDSLLIKLRLRRVIVAVTR
jgi:DNA-binding transcriptional regulator YdaS (Cro superfamily)